MDKIHHEALDGLQTEEVKNNKMTAITFDDILLVPTYNHCDSRRDVDISMTDKLGRLRLSLPIMTSNMDTITESAMATWISSKGGIGILHRFMSIDYNVEQYKRSPKNTFCSVGCSDQEKERTRALYDAGCSNFCVDVAHGHAKYVGKMIKWMMADLGYVTIMAGNVATYAGADYLAGCGADIIKVGIGAGSVCTTRIQTGFGVPQLTAIKECSRVGRSIVADGGIRTPGDVVKALAFGADFVMLGGVLAGTHYTPGEVRIKPARPISEEMLILSDVFPDHARCDGGIVKQKRYRGMASKEVADDCLGGLTEWKTAEGVSTSVPYKDEKESDAIIADIVGGLRSGLTYGGATNIRELQRKLDYVVVTPAGRIESVAHKELDRG